MANSERDAAIAIDLMQIRTATFGKDVRAAIADGIEQCYADASTGTTLADAAAQAANDAAELANEKAQAAADATDTLEDKVNDIVLVQETEPTSDTNKLWVKPESDEFKVPTWDEFQELASDIHSAGIGVDKTLTIPDMAADAKAVGDRVSGIENEVGVGYSMESTVEDADTMTLACQIPANTDITVGIISSQPMTTYTVTIGYSDGTTSEIAGQSGYYAIYEDVHITKEMTGARLSVGVGSSSQIRFAVATSTRADILRAEVNSHDSGSDSIRTVVGDEYSASRSITNVATSRNRITVVAPISAGEEVTFALIGDDIISGGDIQITYSDGTTSSISMNSPSRGMYTTTTLAKNMTQAVALPLVPTTCNVRFVIATGIRAELVKNEVNSAFEDAIDIRLGTRDTGKIWHSGNSQTTNTTFQNISTKGSEIPVFAVYGENIAEVVYEYGNYSATHTFKPAVGVDCWRPSAKANTTTATVRVLRHDGRGCYLTICAATGEEAGILFAEASSEQAQFYAKLAVDEGKTQAVRYDLEQTHTSAEKAQARENIGAISIADVNTFSNNVKAGISKDYDDTKTYGNIDYVWNGDKLYSNNVPIPAPEEWKDARWKVASLAKDVSFALYATQRMLVTRDLLMGAPLETAYGYIASGYGGGIKPATRYGNSEKYRYTNKISVAGLYKIMYKRMHLVSNSIAVDDPDTGTSQYYTLNGIGMSFYSKDDTLLTGQAAPIGADSDGYDTDLVELLVPRFAAYARFTVFADTSTYGSFSIQGLTLGGELLKRIEALEEAISDLDTTSVEGNSLIFN